MKKKTKDGLLARNREINTQLGDLYEKAERENRVLTEEETAQERTLTREYETNKRELAMLMAEDELARHREQENRGQQLREYLRGVREGSQNREILLRPAAGNTTANVEASGAINLSIHDIIPTLNEGLGLPPTLRIVTGVTGNEIWPVSVNDVEMEELGEVEALSDQTLDFANITPTARRVGLTVPVSNMAIDNAAFDLMAFVQQKFTIAQKKYLAQKIYSQAAWNGNKGPFSGLSAAGTIDLTDEPYKALLRAVARFSDKGLFEGGVVIVMDCETEALLKATPKIEGAAAGFLIENGKCAGYDYVVSHYINTELDGDQKTLKATEKKFIGIGYFEWFALQQHGDVRLTVDATSQAVAKKNITAVTLNTAWSMTDLSTKINGAADQTQAFALYEVTEGED